MARKNIHYYLIKTARFSGWLLFVLVILYIVTGFSLCGEFDVGKLIDVKTAMAVHQIFEWPLIVVFCVHSGITIYFAMRRWGWIKSKKANCT